MMRFLLCLCSLLILAACAPAADDRPPTAAIPTAAPAIVASPSVAPTPETQSTVAQPPLPHCPTDPLTTDPLNTANCLSGPTLAFYLEDSYEDVYMALFDTRSGLFRELFNTSGIATGSAAWFDGGCALEIDGRVMDLRGAPLWEPPAEVLAAIAGNSADTHGARLSPDRAWLAYLSRPGQQTAAGMEWVDVAVVGASAPFDSVQLTERGGGHPATLLWSTDAAWFYFTDNDERGVPQVYRARPDGGGREQLTAHDAPLGQINALALSPDGRRLAYGVRNLLNAPRPYEYDPADEGWVGILDLEGGPAVRVALPMLAAVEIGRGLVWDAAGARLLVIGDGLPITHDDPLAGRQVRWLAADGTIERSFHQADAPDGQLGWVSPLENIDTLMFSSNAGFYRYESGDLRLLEGAAVPQLGMAIGRRPVGVLPAVVGFGGEGSCGP